MKRAIRLTRMQAHKVMSLMSNGVAHAYIYDEEAESLMMLARDMTERFIPKNVILVENEDARYVTVFKCPTCGNRILGTISEHCYHCGQALRYSKGGGADDSTDERNL